MVQIRRLVGHVGAFATSCYSIPYLFPSLSLIFLNNNLHTQSFTVRNSFEGSPEQQREDQPICFFVSNFIPKGGQYSYLSESPEGVNHCKWYVLQSEEERKLFGDADQDKEEGTISVMIDRQRFFPGTKRANYILRELPAFPSTLPYTIQDVDYYDEEEQRSELMLEGMEEVVQGQENGTCFDFPDWEAAPKVVHGWFP